MTTAFVVLLLAFALLMGLWRRFNLFRKTRSEISLSAASLTVLSTGNTNQNVEPQCNHRDQAVCGCQDRMANPEAAQNQIHSQEIAIPRLYYFAAWTDSGRLLGCHHRHQTVISAANCISEAGGYVVAVERGKLRALSAIEEELFQLALYGGIAVARRLVGFKPIGALKHSLN
jgi:hypothetical protein